MTDSTTAAWSWLRRLIAALLLCCAGGSALAAITVTAVTVNGGATTNTTPGANMTVTVTVVTSTGFKWRATSFTTSPASDLSWCYFDPDTNGNGTYTFSFIVEAPLTDGTFSLHTRAYTGYECTGTASATRTLTNAIVTSSAQTLDHVRIEHDGSAATCSPETISLRACADAACATLYSAGPVTVTLGSGLGVWSANPVTIAGSGSVTLTNATDGTVNLAGTVNAPAAANTALVCYNGGTAGNCALAFSDASCSLDAVEQANSPSTPIFTRVAGNAVTLDVLALFGGALNPASRSTIEATLVEGNATGCSTTALSAPVTFTLSAADAGRRSVTFTPNAAARNVRVRMESGTVVGCSSDNFAIRPDSLTLSATGPGAFAVATDATAGPVLKAGATNFSLSAAAAAGYDGAPVINPNRIQASGAKVGAIAGLFTSASSATSWAAVGGAFTYSEVGYFKLGSYGVYDDTFAAVDKSKVPADCLSDGNLGSASAPADPNVVVGGKVGCYFGSAETSWFGRFIPDRFVLSAGTVVNRSDIPACAASTFSYAGEALKPTFTLTAVNAAGATTENYTGAFARLNVLTQLGLGAVNDPAAGTRVPFPVCLATPAHPCITPGVAGGTFTNGQAVGITAPLTVYRGGAPVGPFADFKIGVAPVDIDGVKIAAYNLDTVNVVAAATGNHALVAGSLMRYGRMGIDNAYGSELLNLTMKLSAQYWNGLGYATNTLDSCTPPAFALFAPADYKGGITAANMPDAKKMPGPALAAGVGKLVLLKPGPAVPTTKGSVKVTSSHSWLPGSARATFGVYKSGPVIYVRETY